MVSYRVLLWTLLLLGGQHVVADERDAADNVADAEARKTAERFLMVLERNPRKGTALDRVLEFHTDCGTLDELAQRLREKAATVDDSKPADAGRAWLLVGVIDDSRGETEAAVEAFERAEKLLPANAMASFALGQCFVTLNRLPDAAAALERAIERKPAPTDLLEIFQTLGRVQQRLAPGDKVVEVWSRLEKLVPNDPRVPELIARTLLDDGHLEAALPRFEALAKAAKDPYRRSELELEVIDIRLKLGQTEQALTDSDRLLSGLKPDHWLSRETRRRVEQAFLLQDDAAGLAKHYEERLTKQPDDVDAVVRLSRALVGLGRSADARKRLESAITRAPKSAELRLELIRLLEQEQRFAEVVTQYEQLDRISPNHPDYVRDWGIAVLNVVQAASLQLSKSIATAVTEDEGVASKLLALRNAATIWRKLVEAKPKDAVVAAQVSGLMRQAGLLDDAAQLLRRAIELAPESLPQREELGEVLDALKQKDESLAVWRSMAEGPRRTANNLAQLAHVLSRFGYRDESLTTIDAACELDRKSLELRFQQAELRRTWKQAESAMSALAAAAALANTPETFDRIVDVEVKVLLESELLTGRIEELQAELARREGSGLQISVLAPLSANDPPTKSTVDSPLASNPTPKLKFEDLTPPHAAQYFRLAKYLEAANQLREATIAAQKASELAPRTGIFLQTAARLLAQDNQWQPAIDLHHKLIAADRRFRVDSLRSITELEMKLGRKERALKAARDLLAAAPSNPEQADFVADVFLRFGLRAEALHVLRRTSRQNPADKRLALQLTEQLLAMPTVSGTALAAGRSAQPPVASAIPLNSGFTPAPIEEARDVLWRVFEQSAKLDDRTEVVRKLSELAVFPGEFDKLTQRLQRLRYDPKLARDATLCLVHIYEQAGDAEKARRELERLLPQEPRDVELLKRMTALCEASGDLDAAIVHQRRLVELSVAQAASLSRSGSESQSGSSNDDERLITLLRKAGRTDEASRLVATQLESERDPARLLREIDRLLAEGQTEIAVRVIRRQLEIDSTNWEFVLRDIYAQWLSGQTLQADSQVQTLLAMPFSDDSRSVLAPASGNSTNSGESTLPTRVAGLTHRLELCQSFHTPQYHGFSPRVRSPSNILGLKPHTTTSRQPSTPNRSSFRVIEDFGQARIAALVLISPKSNNRRPATDSKVRHLWDQVYLSWIGEDDDAVEHAVTQLHDSLPDDPLVQWLLFRSLAARLSPATANNYDELVRAGKALSPDRMTALLAAYRDLRSQPEVQAWADVPLLEVVRRELLLAKRDDEWKKLRNEAIQAARQPDEFAWLIRMTARAGDADTALPLLPKYVASWQSLPPRRGSSPQPATQADPSWVAWWIQHLMLAPAEARTQASTLKILDVATEAFSSPNLPGGSMNGLMSTISRQAQTQQLRVFVSGQGASMWPAPPRSDGHLMEVHRFDFPQSSRSSETCVIQVLVQAYLIATRDKWQWDLQAYLEADVERTEPGSRGRFIADLRLASLLAWTNQHQKALPVMQRLFDQAAGDAPLQISIALAHLRQAQDATALELLDRIETTDGALIKDIELRALELAAKLKNTERARVAAERLFGIKLEPAEELALAKQLSELGLKAESQALFARAPQRHANDVGMLLQIMKQHENQQNLDEACQIAEQIVRRTQPIAMAKTLAAAQAAGAGQPQARVGAVSEDARLKALGLLASAGRLTPLIEQSEQQFESSPNSLRVFSQLTEFYSAATAAVPLTERAGYVEKQKALLARVAKTESPDPVFRLQIARSLVAAGSAKEAVPHYLFVLEKSPNATSQVLFEAENIIQELGNAEDLARVVLRSKVAANDAQRVELFNRLVFRLHGPPIKGRLIIELFQKGWRESPDFRPQLAQRLLTVEPSVWQQEEMWDLVREFVLPAADRQAVATWSGVDVMRQQHGYLDGLLPRLLDLAQEQKQLDALAAETEAALKKHPGWLGGRLLLAMIRLRQGNIAQARTLLIDLLKENSSPPTLLSLAVGYELARHKELIDVALRFYDPALTGSMSWEVRRIVLDHCRVHRQTTEFQQMAIDILLSLLPTDELAPQNNQTISDSLGDVSTIAKDLNQPYIAARLAQALRLRGQCGSRTSGSRTRQSSDSLDQSDRSLATSATGTTGDVTWMKQFEERFAQACVAIKPDMLPMIFRLAARERPARKRSRPQLDLLPQVIGESVAELQLHSPILACVKAAAADDKLWPEVVVELNRLREQFPDDLSIAIAAAQTELSSPKRPRELKSVRAAVELATKQSGEAKRQMLVDPQLALWIIVGQVSNLPKKEDKQVENLLHKELATLSIAATQRQRDPRFLWAIRREQGQLALQRGDRDDARQFWTMLIADVLHPRSPEETVPMLVQGRVITSGEWPEIRMSRATALARMTLDAGFGELSLQAFRDSVRFWHKDNASTRTFGPTATESSLGTASFGGLIFNSRSHVLDFASESVVAAWEELEPRWRQQQVSADAIFAALADCVLPSGPRGEVFVFARPMERATPASLGGRLVQLAVAESRVEELRKRLASREKSKQSEMSLRLMKLQLALATGDDALFAEQFAELEQQPDGAWLAQEERIAAQIVRLLSQQTVHLDRTAKLFTALLSSLSGTSAKAEFPAADLRRWLARHHLKNGQADQGRDTIAAHLRHMEGVWSSAGAMDGQHLRRLELLELAQEYAAAGLAPESLELLGQAADARWPDKFADENPGAVLATLEKTLQSRPAAERYMLWKMWSLPDGGGSNARSQMRLMSGSASLTDGNQTADAKLRLISTARLLIESAREANRLDELATFVATEGMKRFDNRVNVLLALIRLAQSDVSAAEPLLKKTFATGEPTDGKASSILRTQAWDDGLLAAACSQHNQLRELGAAFAKRAAMGARELKDAALLGLLPTGAQSP